MKYGKSITKITLNEAEFVHPQTLNPLALKCPRLKSLTLLNPSTISDNLFVGEGIFFLRQLNFHGDISYSLLLCDL